MSGYSTQQSLPASVPPASYLAKQMQEDASLVRDYIRGGGEALQDAKAVVRSYQTEFAAAKTSQAALAVLSQCTGGEYLWRGVHPFNELKSVGDVVDVFWAPFLEAFGPIQRRDDIFLAGKNDVDGGATIWVCSMGHFFGLFDGPWLGIPPTYRLTPVRYCEFSRVSSDGLIVESCMHVDILSVMHQAGQYPLPPMTGACLIPSPGPRTHDGLLFEPQSDDDSVATVALLHLMNNELIRLNQESKESGNNECPPEVLATTWADDMMWYGPAGIGTTGLSIRRYQKQHQMPFRNNLYDKDFKGHIARFAEGSYEAWFGWPNLTNKALGGFMGLPGSETVAELRVVDVYRREGDKIVENWIFIDMLRYLMMRGLDVLERMRELRSPN
jgi:hypothetical protein